MNTTKMKDEIVELCADDVDLVSGGVVGHVAVAVGMLYIAYQVVRHVEQQAM
ncbi:hypothetical protein JNB91_15765 [Rhizobium wenxiniae]|uniref:hypothetical protein n=1 Tax=Rhizobium wenxiniae TaxID=1737357 RepID=UPI001C6F24FF|nr:hypothetical protein [Rhizobium wenxiniae]MBW9089293.1 hypothetical protein [Rhizobium wenxiniae]